MLVLEWVLFLIGGGLLLCGLVTFIIEIIGVFRFRYVLNRMHAAAIGGTLGIGFALLGLIVISGFNFTSLKLLLVIVFLWFSSPVSSHLIARLEVSTNEESGKHYLVKNLIVPDGGAEESREHCCAMQLDSSGSKTEESGGHHMAKNPDASAEVPRKEDM